MRRILAHASLAAALAVLLTIAAGSASAVAPPGTKTVHTRGITIAYKSIGTGRPLLLINGSGATLDTWDPALLEALGAKRRIVIFDPRGMGATTDVAGGRLTVEKMADDAAGLLAALHIKRADVLGWSLGGFVAQEVAIRHAALVRRLVLASSSPGGRNATEATPEVQAIDEKATRGPPGPAEVPPNP